MDDFRKISYFTLDERLALHQGLMLDHVERLKGDLIDDDRQILENYKKEEEAIIKRLEIRKEQLLANPRFLLLIASTTDYQVFKTISTYIETADEAKFDAENIIRKLLADNNVILPPAVYLVIIVRKSFYDKEVDKINVSKFNNNINVHITDKELQITNKDVFFL
jgi:hypothetical protein